MAYSVTRPTGMASPIIWVTSMWHGNKYFEQVVLETQIHQTNRTELMQPSLSGLFVT